MIYPRDLGVLEWSARDGSTETIPAPPHEYFAPRLSRDGRSFVVGTMGFVRSKPLAV